MSAFGTYRPTRGGLLPEATPRVVKAQYAAANDHHIKANGGEVP